MAAPTIDSVTPDRGAVAGGTHVTIRGSGFSVGDVTVTFAGSDATDIEIVADDVLTCTTPAATAGDADVIVTNDDDDVTAADGFTYGIGTVVRQVLDGGGAFMVFADGGDVYLSTSPDPVANGVVAPDGVLTAFPAPMGKVYASADSGTADLRIFPG